MSIATRHTVETLDELLALYDEPNHRALNKVTHAFDAHCRAFIAASPFMLLATYGPTRGTDCSPRGDKPGWVEVADDQTLHIPDRRGNNRLDSLRNIVEFGRVGLLFMVPGVTETLRVNGNAHLSTDPELLARFEVDGKTPRTVIVVKLVETYMQCARALVRSDLWNPDKQVKRDQLASMGQILEAHSCGLIDGAAYDIEAPTIIPKTLY
jgi:PPOX class probable FMN-dependent enzyme